MTMKLWMRRTLALAAALCIGPLWAAVDVNKGGVADLDAIKGIGPAMSARILEERRRGPFRDWADLVRRVKGIGPATAARFSSGGLTVNGEPYATGSTASPGTVQPERGRQAARTAERPFTRTEVTPGGKAAARVPAASS